MCREVRVRGGPQSAAEKDGGPATRPLLYNSTLPTGHSADQSEKWNFWNWLLSHKIERYNLLGGARERFLKHSRFLEFLEWNFWNVCVCTGIESDHMFAVSSYRELRRRDVNGCFAYIE